MGFDPGKWSRTLIEVAEKGATGIEQNLGDYEPETKNKVMEAAREWAEQFTVTIATTGIVRNSKQAKDMAFGSGVVIQQHGNTYGVLTAGHVLRRGDNTSDSASVALLTPPRYEDDDTMGIDLHGRPCTVVGIDNSTEEGPDIAIIPLERREVEILDARGIIAYNLDKVRWSDKDKAKLGGMSPWFLSIIYGVRAEASQILYSHTDGRTGSLAVIATNTIVNVVKEKDGYDYLELPAEKTEFSHPIHWKEMPPGTAAEEIEHLFSEGVTRQVWGGTSGAGVWNMAIGSNQNGQPDGRVLGELAGICFYANPEKRCVVAHGTKSITKIAESHLENEALRYHNLL